MKSVQVIDSERLVQEVASGLQFRSNIPTGYGMGSSGALCAAIFQRYSRENITDLAELKALFGRMESFFHGNSSGIDPLTSFLGTPVLIEHKTEVQQVLPQEWGEKAVVFLIDSRLPRRTGPLVEWFLEQQRHPEFAHRLDEEYLPAHRAVLHAWLTADADLFWLNLRQVSEFQYQNFGPMIPQTLQVIWQKSLDNQDVVLKICGAGGGGFVLGFARNRAAAQTFSEGFPLLFPFEPPSPITPPAS